MQLLSEAFWELKAKLHKRSCKGAKHQKCFRHVDECTTPKNGSCPRKKGVLPQEVEPFLEDFAHAGKTYTF